MKLYSYKAFNLYFRSEFEIPEFINSEGITDVEIKIGKVPNELEKVTKYGVKFQAAKDEFLLEVDHIAKYFVKKGNEILIEPLNGEINKEVRLFLLGSVLGALFIQRGLLPIHGSAIKSNNHAHIFTGISGVGKSSIAAYFAKSGFSFLADDISVVNKQLHVVPGFPNMKIWKDVLEKLEIENGNLTEIRPEIQKYHLPLNHVFYQESLPIKNIFIINIKNTPGFEYEELSGIQKFNAVKNNTYRYRLVGGLEKHYDHFQMVNKLLADIKVYKVSRPQSPIMLKEFAEFLINSFNLNA